MDDYPGVERRRDNIRLEVYTERWDNFMKDTVEYRKSNDIRAECIKKTLEKNTKELLDEVIELKQAILKLPCPQREEITKGFREQFRLVWIFVASIILAIVGEWILLRR